jgi:hypothetical protein
MGLIFDAVNPARQFKRGTVFDPSANHPYPKYNPNSRDDPDVTEYDPEPILQPYLARIYQ